QRGLPRHLDDPGLAEHRPGDVLVVVAIDLLDADAQACRAITGSLPKETPPSRFGTPGRMPIPGTDWDTSRLPDRPWKVLTSKTPWSPRARTTLPRAEAERKRPGSAHPCWLVPRSRAQ